MVSFWFSPSQGGYRASTKSYMARGFKGLKGIWLRERNSEQRLGNSDPCARDTKKLSRKFPTSHFPSSWTFSFLAWTILAAHKQVLLFFGPIRGVRSCGGGEGLRKPLRPYLQLICGSLPLPSPGPPPNQALPLRPRP